jgi:hypothetical protein
MEALKVQYREYKAVKPGSYRAKIKAVGLAQDVWLAARP